MRKLLWVCGLLCGLLLVGTLPAAAQSYNNMFGIEYDQIRIREKDSSSGVVTHFHLNGFSLNYTRFFLGQVFGLEGDFQFDHGTPFNVSTNYELGGGGIRLQYPGQRVRPWAHAVVGVGHISFKETGVSSGHEFFGRYIGTVSTTQGSNRLSDTGFAGKFGGGLDIVLTPHISLKLIETNYVPTHLFGETQHNFGWNSGIHFNF